MAKADATKPAPKPQQQGGGKAAQAKGQPRREKTPETQPAIAKGRPKGTGQLPARLKDVFAKTVVPALMKERGYDNVWAVPRLNKIVINMGVGEGRDNAKIMDFATADLQAITGQKPIVTRAKKSIANFKLREGVPPKGFDGRGNYALGLREQLIFPEIVYDKIDKVRGMDIIFVTTARTDEDARALLAQLGMPFRES